MRRLAKQVTKQVQSESFEVLTVHLGWLQRGTTLLQFVPNRAWATVRAAAGYSTTSSYSTSTRKVVYSAKNET